MTLAAPKRVLVVDLNNFARYPTVAVGYLVAVLRKAGMTVDVFSPLSVGLSGVPREAPPGRFGLIRDKVGYRTAVSENPFVRRARAWLARRRAPDLAAKAEQVAAAVSEQLSTNRPDAVLISTYLMYQPLCRRIAAACQMAGVPVLVGGPYFFQPEVAKDWVGMEGIAGLVGGEVELRLPEIVDAIIAGESLSRFPGIWSQGTDGRAHWIPAPALQELDRVPFPDYADFPWSRYPNRIVPIITGRGCAWGACAFCSDVTSTAGRTFRSRSPENVLAEIAHQHATTGAKLFTFVDLKLNSNPAMWAALAAEMQHAAPGCEWIGSLHIGTKDRDALSTDAIRAAAAAGMVRLTTGLESGSQRVLDRMAKGTDLAITSRVLRDAKAAGISVRNTMILGYPGEEAADVRASADFLRSHSDCVERVMLNRFQLMTGTHVHRQLERHPAKFPQLAGITPNHRLAQIEHHFAPANRPDYRRAVYDLLRVVHDINRRPLSSRARAFEGVM